jgi:hypothetical protein
MPLPHQFLCPSLRFITPRTPPSIATFSKAQPSLRITSKSSFITNTRPFSSTAKMGITAYFDVEYTTADGQPRKHWTTPTFPSLAHHLRCLFTETVVVGTTNSLRHSHPLISILTAMFASQNWPHQLQALRRCSPEDCRKLPCSLHRRERLRVQGQQVPSHHPPVHATGRRFHSRKC